MSFGSFIAGAIFVLLIAMSWLFGLAVGLNDHIVKDAEIRRLKTCIEFQKKKIKAITGNKY